MGGNKVKILKENYRNFYFGSAAETYIQSEFYSLGYEAYKAQPDIGYDLCVTNNSLVKFEDHEIKQYNVQVKSRFIWEQKTKVYISQEDFDMILNDENGILIVVFQKPRVAVDEYAFWEPREGFDLYMIDNYLELSWHKNLLTNGEIRSAAEAEDALFVLGYDKEYFWLNNSQLKRLKEDGFIFKEKLDGNDMVYLRVDMESLETEIEELEEPEEQSEYQLIKLINKDEEMWTLSRVLFSLKYLVFKEGVNTPFFAKGRIFVEDFDY